MKSIGKNLIAIALGLFCLAPAFAEGPTSRTKTIPADVSGVSNEGIAKIGAKVCTADNTNCYNQNNEPLGSSGDGPPGSMCGSAFVGWNWAWNSVSLCNGKSIVPGTRAVITTHPAVPGTCGGGWHYSGYTDYGGYYGADLWVDTSWYEEPYSCIIPAYDTTAYVQVDNCPAGYAIGRLASVNYKGGGSSASDTIYTCIKS